MSDDARLAEIKALVAAWQAATTALDIDNALYAIEQTCAVDTPWLVAEVERLRAALAAAETERERLDAFVKDMHRFGSVTAVEEEMSAQVVALRGALAEAEHKWGLVVNERAEALREVIALRKEVERLRALVSWVEGMLVDEADPMV